MKTYKCKICKEEWEFYADMYDYKKKLYPTICPQCSIPYKEAFIDIWWEDGTISAIIFCAKRFIGELKNIR